MRLLAFLAAFFAIFVPAAPAFAHAGAAPLASAYRVTVDGVSRPEEGLSIRAVEAGARLELSNDTGHSVEVLGYSGEPYLDVRPEGTFQNVNSPAAYTNQTLTGDTPVPATADPTAPPVWRRVSTSTTVRWHDQRTHWLSPGLPPAAAADPSHGHLLRSWQVPLRYDTSTFTVSGTLSWEPPPRAWLWWLLTLLAAAACVVPARRSPRLLALFAGLFSLVYAGQHLLDGSSPQLVQVVAALVAIGAAWRSPPFVQLLAGAVLAIFAGFTESSVFSSAVLPVGGPGIVARLAVLSAIAIGAALAVDGVRLLKAASIEAPEPGELGAPFEGRFVRGG